MTSGIFLADRLKGMRDTIRPIVSGAAAFAAMLGLYFGVLTLVSGWSFTLSQFAELWPSVVTLAIGFGTQVGLYVYLKQLSENHHHAHHVVVASGTTSTAAMLACCAHYLTNVLPVLGIVGAAALVAQYQTQLFWISLAFNAAGLVYIGRQVLLARKAFIGSPAC